MASRLLPYKSHQQKLAMLLDGSLNLSDNVAFFLNRIKQTSHLNAFLDVYNEDAMLQAKFVSSKIKNGTHGKLAGMVIAVKDALSIKDKKMTCGSKILENFIPLYTSTAVQKLIDDDAIIIGKTNMDEFAMGSSNENSAYGIVRNPVNQDYVPGGSSGGSAAAVSADLCDASIGSDTGGSIRQPAAFCGVIGLKPTYGRISRFGLTSFASSFDTIGPFSKNIADIALLLNVMSGKDEMDSTSSPLSVEEYDDLGFSNRKFKIGISKDFLSTGISEEIVNAFNLFIGKAKDFGHEIINIDLPHSEYSIAAYYILTTAEASSNLARFDGARYGKRSSSSVNLNSMYINSRSEGFGDEVKRRIMLGTYVLSSGYYDAYYKKAQQVRRIIKNDFDIAFDKVDLILTPTTPTPTFKIGEKSNNPLEMYLSDVFTTSANLAGIPAISIPVAKTESGLPIGLQLLANQFDEKILLQLSYQMMHHDLS